MYRSLSFRLMAGLLSSLLLVPQGILAQTATNEQLLEVIKKLEARVAELEGKVGKQDIPETTTAAAKTEPAPADIQELKKEVDALKKKDEEAAPVLNFFKSTQVTGYVDAYYAYNINRPPDQVVASRGLKTDDNSFSFNAAKLSFYRPTSGLNSLGYRLDFVYGPLAESFNVPFEPSTAGFSIQRNILNAYVSYTAPVGKGLTFDFGKFTTFVGGEVFDTIDNWNYQQGILFSYAQPYYHEGLRTTYNASDKVALGFYLVNGWNNSFDNNRPKSVGFSVAYTPNSKFQLIQNYLGGAEKSLPGSGWRHLYDGIASFTINKNLALKFNYDIGKDMDTYPGTANPDAQWRGVSTFLRINTSNNKIALSPRFEYLWDNSGFATGTKQDLKTFTLTNEYRIKPNFSTKLEYRYDFSNQPIFKDHLGDFIDHQNVVLVGLVYSFGFGKE
jgi:hypothetical protein